LVDNLVSGALDGRVLEDSFEDIQPEFKDGKIVEPLPVLKEAWATHGVHKLAGNGRQTNQFCGNYLYSKVCLHVGLHDKVTLDGVNHAGKVPVHKVHHWCNKISCPICHNSGYAIREAVNIEARLTENGKFKGGFGRFGQIEHIVCSVSPADYDLDEKVLRCKVHKILQGLGVMGYALIFHGFRYADWETARRKNVPQGWRWSPHWHVLGFIFGGYSKCRNCKRKSNCNPSCGGFDDRAWKSYQKTKYYTKVMGKRKTVFGTSYYQLTHATYRTDVKRYHAITWAGVCSYRKLKDDDYFHFPAKSDFKTKRMFNAIPKRVLIDKLLPERCWGAKWTLPKKVNDF